MSCIAPLFTPLLSPFSLDYFNVLFIRPTKPLYHHRLSLDDGRFLLSPRQSRIRILSFYFMLLI